MTKRQYGLIAGLAGAAFAAWRYFGRRGTVADEATANVTRGEVIYRNDPAMFP
jgi:hypothetical protein